MYEREGRKKVSGFVSFELQRHTVGDFEEQNMEPSAMITPITEAITQIGVNQDLMPMKKVLFA